MRSARTWQQLAETNEALMGTIKELTETIAELRTDLARLNDICEHQRATLYFLEDTDGAELHASDACYDRIERAEAELAEAVAVVRAVEYVDRLATTHRGWCPRCGEDEPQHEPDCTIGLLIQKHEARR